MANFWQSSFHENPQWWTDGNNPYTQGSTDNYRQPRQTSPADCASHTAYPIEHSHTVHHPPSSTVALGFDPLIEEINNEIPFYNPSFINEPEENTFYESPMAEQQYNVMQPKEAYDESESQRSSAWLEQSQAWHSIGFEQMAPPRFTSKVIANSPSLQPEGMYYVDQSRRHSYSPMWNTLGNAVNSTISNFTLGFEGAYNNQYPLTSNKNREAMRGRSQSLYVSSGVTAPDITHRRATVGPFGESPMGFISAQREPPTWTIHLLEVPQGTNDELSSFSDTVKKIRDEYPSSKSNANSGKIWSVSTPVSDQLPCNTSFTIHVHIGGLYLPLILTPKAGCLVKHFIRDILHHINQYPPQEDYFLSLCGSDEFLQNENSLVSHENILKANTDVQLWLHKESSLRRKLARTYEDDNSHFNLNEGMDCASTWRVNRQNLSAAIFNYCSQLALLVQRQCPLSTVIREVRTVCSLLSCVETKEIRDAAEALRLASAQSAQLNASYLLYGTLEAAVTNLSRAISHLIYIYSRSFHADFQTASPQSSLNCTKASLDTELNFVLHVGHNIPEEWTKSYKDFSVFCSVTYAGKKLCQVRNSRKVPATKSLFFMITWEEKIIFPLNVKSLPHETMLTIKLYGTSISTRTANILGWTFIPLYQKEWFVHGTILLGLTYGEPPIVTTPGVFDSRFPAHITLQISFPEMEHRFIKPQFEQKSNNSAPTEEYFKHIVKLSQQQPSLLLLPEAEKGFLWFYRSFCSSKNCYLPLVLGSAPGWDPHTVSAIHTVLRDWTFQNPLDALGLLTSSFSDQDVRKAAVQEIDKLSDDDLFEYLPQLVQAVKFDWHLESALVKLLLSRSMQSIRVAHQLHWLLADALNEALYKSRYQRLLGALQVCIGKALNDEFSKEKKLINILIEVAEKVKAAHDSKRQEVLKTELKRLDQLFGEIQVCRLPLDPAMVVTGINGNACSYFTSNAFPLKVSFINEDPLGKDINVIFKAGDDLRQDMIVLQITRIMDRLWLHEGLDMHMVIFKCQSTGKGRGLVQMVPDATTLAKIHMNSGIIGPLKENTIKKWFGHHNPVEASYQKASENFYYSCAGWCVVTFILGVCDRHNDNIMLTKTGHMFHIDFGKFLGHSQKFGSIKRDRAPFIFTSEMEYFITEGGKNPSRFQEFVELCCRAYNIVRKHSHLILNLLDLMLQADLPELNSAQDVKYVYNNLRPWETELEATSTFTRKIKESVECLPVKLNNLIHILAQMAHLHSTKSASQHNSQESSIIRVTDRSIQRATILRFSKTHERLYLVQVLKSNGAVSLTQKAFAEFLELHHQLKNQYPTLYLPAFPSSQNVTSTDLDHKRMQDLNIYLQQMFSGSYELAHNEQVLQFLLDESKSMGFDYLYFAEPGYTSSDQNPEVQVHISHENQKLTILLKHMKNIRMPDGSAPSAHVNVYLLPDPDEISRRKTKTIPKTSNPTYNDIVEYPGIQRLQGRFLKLIVKSKGTFLGAVSIPLSTAPLNEERWYRLGKSPY